MTSLQQYPIRRFLLSICHASSLIMLSDTMGHGGNYLTSAHGNSTAGVNRTFTASLNYAKGNCAHCHEQHANVQGDTHAPYPYTLFAENHTDQSNNVCLKCHTEVGSVQEGGIINRSYSYRAGNYDDGLNDIEEAFSSTSSHNLDDIQTFISTRWGYNPLSNPCAGCHNPHTAQGDPANDDFSAKTSLSRGWPVARPSQHGSSLWIRWGDDDTERMDDFTTAYQAPYRFGSTSTFEPDGSSTEDGSNLTDYNSFCLDCHQYEVAASGTTSAHPGTTAGKLTAIDWNNEKHGKGDADVDLRAEDPYNPASMGYVLSCLDCHEPHGSENIYLIRREVNGSAVTTIDDGYKLGRLCESCHDPGILPGWQSVHHASTDDVYQKQGEFCAGCHPTGSQPHSCISCHFHGGISGSNGIPEVTADANLSRRTF